MEKRLEKILENIESISIDGSIEKIINKISFDSRDISTGDMFIAQKGTIVDGHKFINSVIKNGASAIVCEQLPEELPSGVCFILVNDTSVALAKIASNYYNNPSAKIKLVGVTGTNGKTTIASLLYQLFMKMGCKTGLLSTVKNCVNNKTMHSTHTTPDALSINKLLYQMHEESCEYCFMEVSSHALDQNRTCFLNFDGAIFTNLTHDHLDYHHTFKNYLNTKKKFFDNLEKTAFALINTDDKNAKVMVQNTKANKLTYSCQAMANYKCRIVEEHFDGMLLDIDSREVWSHFIGNFNAQNLLAVYATACLLGKDKDDVLVAISELKSVEGRFETIISSDGIMAIVDYAHTPDALKNVLNTIGLLRTRNEEVITVVGCGGDRDKTKRPLMAKIASQMCDKLILTSDNPRTEDPQSIIDEMKAGVLVDKKRNLLSILDRKEAIRTACLLAKKGDIILIAGKGHEDYQEINGVRNHFDDKEILREIFNL